jgi:hypothetical protein
MEIRHNQFENELGILLMDMNTKQVGQFLTALSATSLLFLSDRFLFSASAQRYLNPILITLHYNCTTWFISRARAFNRARALDRALDRAIDLDRDRALERTLDRDLARTLARTLTLTLDLDRNRALDRARDLTRAIALDHALDRAHAIY